MSKIVKVVIMVKCTDEIYDEIVKPNMVDCIKSGELQRELTEEGIKLTATVQVINKTKDQ